MQATQDKLQHRKGTTRLVLMGQDGTPKAGPGCVWSRETCKSQRDAAAQRFLNGRGV